MARKFTAEFKRRDVELYFARGKDSTVAAELGIGRSTLLKWVKEFHNELNPVLINEAEEIKRLQRENARLMEENAILKKAAAFFAQDSLPKK
jgi:transposase